MVSQCCCSEMHCPLSPVVSGGDNLDNSSSMLIKSFEFDILPMELEDAASLEDSVEDDDSAAPDDPVEDDDSVSLDESAWKSLEEDAGLSSGMPTGDELEELSQLIQQKAALERNSFPKILRTLLFMP